MRDHIVKLGALAIFRDMIEGSPEEKKESFKTWSAWCEGFAAGLNEAGVISDDTLDELIEWISTTPWQCN